MIFFVNQSQSSDPGISDPNDLIFDGAADGRTYTGGTSVAVGGIAAGSILHQKSYRTIVDLMFWPFQAPSFGSFSISGQATTLELGQPIVNGDKIFIWSTNQAGNVAANSLVIADITRALTLGTGLANDNSELLGVTTLVNNTTTSNTWRITGTNTQAGTFTRDFVVSWKPRVYWGNFDTTGIVAADIANLTGGSNALQSTRVGSFIFTGGGFKYILIPNTISVAGIQFKDPVNGNIDIDMLLEGTITQNNAYGVSITYNVYRTKNKLGGNLTMQIL